MLNSEQLENILSELHIAYTQDLFYVEKGGLTPKDYIASTYSNPAKDMLWVRTGNRSNSDIIFSTMQGIQEIYKDKSITQNYIRNDDMRYMLNRYYHHNKGMEVGRND